MRIISLNTDNNEHLDMWKDFLEKTPHLIIHTPEYNTFIKKTFHRTKTEYLAVCENNKINLILPLQLISHPILGKKIISSAFLEYGSFAGEDDEDFIRIILNYINENYSQNYNYLEIRQGLLNFNKYLEDNLIKREEYKRFELKLIDLDTNWGLIQKEKRKAIRKSDKEGVIVKEINNQQINEIYDLYSKNMKSFGSPCFPKNFFINLFDLNLGKCFGAYYNDKLISLLLGFCYKQTIHLIIAVSDKKYLWSRCNDAVHWHFIKYGIKHNYKTLDFGRVRPESGQFDYKKKWGCELRNLDHFYDLYKIKGLPSEDPTSRKFKILTKVWSNLPLIITKKIGPWAREGTGK